MKLRKEFLNGFIIAATTGAFFLLMDAMGYGDLFYLRLINVIFVLYGVNRSVQMNIVEGENSFVKNAVSAMITALIGVFLSIIGLIIYSYLQGGDAYVENLSKTFLFGGNPSIFTYSASLLFEGVAASVIVTMLLMLYWNNRLTSD
ncbi:hypothetical protein [Flavobacterium hiemivividum]|uniref:DUF4199 domain-containing protein n=1 Tax=Flavobacterium hiemivividum TaxID=2541734 RepID=A0A4R5CZI1_9FLAO|nr:hypothetical protein [Flavobacterium hiemivividum]TDE04960.1 hypothetical protein E0F98_06355 [Flavobacterium hiemivividum]